MNRFWTGLKYVLDKLVEIIVTLLKSPIALILALLYLGVFRLEELKVIADMLKELF